MNKLILDGKEYELSDELVEKLKESVAAQDWMRKSEEQSPFCRTRETPYYLIDNIGKVGHLMETGQLLNDSHYDVANYCRDEAMMKQRALHETLNRLLWRYSEIHGGDYPWDSTTHSHFYIYYRNDNRTFTVGCSVATNPIGTVFFKDEETAKAAIDAIVKPFLVAHPEFVW